MWWKKQRIAEDDGANKWCVSLEDGTIAITVPIGVTARMALGDLASIAIETRDCGPLQADVWWLLRRADDEFVRFPIDAIGERPVVEALTSLPGFRFEPMTAAMLCTENALFEVWKRGEPSSAQV